MPDERDLDIRHGVPPVAISTTSTLANKTGSWKYIRPVYRDQVAPCNQACPVGIDIEGCMNLVREGRVDEARDLLLLENPLPAVTGRVCYRPCENVCNRLHFDDSVSIHAVERMLGDLALEGPRPRRPSRKTGKSIGVVGSGPAGLACAYHLVRLGHAVTVYEADTEPGGILRYGIPSYRLPKDVLAGEIERIRSLGVTFKCGKRVGRETPWKTLDKHDAIFLAVGVHKSHELGIEGEQAGHIFPGLAFLRFISQGTRPQLGRRVVVVGGGNTAIDCARSALRLGAEVLVVYRRTRDEMPANPEEVEDALREGVRFQYLAAPIRACHEPHAPDEDALEAIESTFDPPGTAREAPRFAGLQCVRMRLGDPDASGRRRPIPMDEQTFFVPADTVLTALGEVADWRGVPEDIDHDDFAVRVDGWGGTNTAAVFAGGDITEQPHTVAFALGSGKRTAIGIDRFLKSKAGWTAKGAEQDGLTLGPQGNVNMARWKNIDPIHRESPVNEVVAVDQINTDHFEPVKRRQDTHVPPGVSSRSFAEANLGLNREGALAEARRCFNCGVCNQCELCMIFCPDLAITRRDDGLGFDINYDYCKGCGVCAVECPRGAITMTREGT
jgi:2-oxoacid:acceptor oxidoreductase delta subunit (pyruvate/2-ketoisovalerate family)